jgi:NAD(P)-dependent dehydrogenase (short-subunit alcohol dehydrogenase family)
VNAGLSGKSFKDDPGSMERCIAAVPIKRLISSEEVAFEVAHLCDPRNRHMTGNVSVMDGGLSLRTP